MYETVNNLPGNMYETFFHLARAYYLSLQRSYNTQVAKNQFKYLLYKVETYYILLI